MDGMQSASLSGAVNLLEGRELVEEEPLCLNLRSRLASCDRCARACHSGALALSPDALQVDREKCTGCGGCVPTCPAGALRLTGFSPGRFLEALAGCPEVHLHCTESTDGGGGVVIPCHKVLDARLLAASRAEGVEVIHLHGLGQCRGCRHGGALRTLARARSRVREWLGPAAPHLQTAAGARGSVGLRRREDQLPVSRRAFLRLAGAQAAAGAAQWLVPREADVGVADLPFFQGDTQEIHRPHPYQSALAERAANIPWMSGHPPPWRLRTLAEHCTACLTCGRRCPTGALQAQEDSRSAGIRFEPALCTDCGLCVSLCPVDAVETRPVRSAREVGAPRSTLMMRRLERCTQCGHPFLPAQTGEISCPICRNERELDEEWMAMLEG